MTVLIRRRKAAEGGKGGPGGTGRGRPAGVIGSGSGETGGSGTRPVHQRVAQAAAGGGQGSVWQETAPAEVDQAAPAGADQRAS